MRWSNLRSWSRYSVSRKPRSILAENDAMGPEPLNTLFSTTVLRWSAALIVDSNSVSRNEVATNAAPLSSIRSISSMMGSWSGPERTHMASSPKTEFDENEQRKRDELLLKLLKTPPEHRPKRDRKDKPESVAEKGVRR